MTAGLFGAPDLNGDVGVPAPLTMPTGIAVTGGSVVAAKVDVQPVAGGGVTVDAVGWTSGLHFPIERLACNEG